MPRPASSAKSHDSDLDSYDQHDTENQVQGSGAKERSHNRRSPSPKAEASILEQGADGVPGKSGSPGRSILGSGDVQAVPSTDADTTTSLNDRALCVLGARCVQPDCWRHDLQPLIGVQRRLQPGLCSALARMGQYRMHSCAQCSRLCIAHVRILCCQVYMAQRLHAA